MITIDETLVQDYQRSSMNKVLACQQYWYKGQTISTWSPNVTPRWQRFGEEGEYYSLPSEKEKQSGKGAKPNYPCWSHGANVQLELRGNSVLKSGFSQFFQPRHITHITHLYQRKEHTDYLEYSSTVS